MPDGPNAGVELGERLRATQVDVPGLSQFLDSLSHAERVEAIRTLGRGDQRRLWDAVEGFAPLTLSDLVPSGVPGGATVRHFGKNTLPAFTHFEKHFTRPETEDASQPRELHGFNFQKLSPITGPGYFVARASEDGSEVLVDYHYVPQVRPEGWPRIRPNDRGLSRFIYGFMIDTVRRVSEHVTIGSAARAGKDMGSWFVLSREA